MQAKFGWRQADVIRKLAQEHGLTTDEVLKRAIAMFELAAGAARPDGTITVAGSKRATVQVI
jgi:hypothetical protein